MWPHPQILLNVKRGNSGELSLLTCALSLAGNLARVFTTMALEDPIILGSAATQVGWAQQACMPGCSGQGRVLSVEGAYHAARQPKGPYRLSPPACPRLPSLPLRLC